jgi:hypothetical protein
MKWLLSDLEDLNLSDNTGDPMEGMIHKSHSNRKLPISGLFICINVCICMYVCIYIYIYIYILSIHMYLQYIFMLYVCNILGALPSNRAVPLSGGRPPLPVNGSER